MNTKIMTQVLIVTGAVALASVASAQHAGAGAAVRAVPAVPAIPAAPATPAVPAVPAVPPTPTVSAGATAGSNAAAAGAVRAPVIPPGSASAQGHGRVGAGASASSSGLNVNASDHASAQGQANGLSVATVASDRTRASLRMDETVHAIRGASFATRDQVTAEVQARLDDSEKVVTELRVKADAAGDKSRAAFARALANVRKQERQVRADLRAATKAAGESTWGSVQSELAKSYGAYAKAVAEAEVAAQGSTETPKS